MLYTHTSRARPARHDDESHTFISATHADTSMFARRTLPDVLFWKILEFWRTDRDP